MRVIARQIWWLQVIRIAIGCATICCGVQLMFYSMISALLHHQTKQAFVMVPGGILIALAGFLFAIYSRLEWRPRGVAVAITRRGLILKANGFRCPKLVAIKWAQIRKAIYIPGTWFPYQRTSVAIMLTAPMEAGTLPTHRGGVIATTPEMIGLTGLWEQWHPHDVAQLISDAAVDSSFRETL